MSITPHAERRRPAPFRTRLQRALRPILGDDAAAAAQLLARLAARISYDASAAAELLELARGATSPRATWPVRRLACLALEHELLRITDADALRAFVASLGARSADELRRRIGRYDAVHAAFARDPLSSAADFAHHSLHECRLVLGRYLLSPADVVEQIVAQVRTTAGLPHLPETDPYNLREAERAREALPPYEREIVRLLRRHGVIYWVADQTPSTLHALVEYPIGTIALVIKPPGSDLEIEIKRAGSRGEKAIDCVYQREGAHAPVPVHHHFWGGSTGRLLRWELSCAGLIARLHRLAYGSEAPTSRVVALSGIVDVPTPRGDVSLVSYFTNARAYGRGYDAMREAMKRALPRLERDRLHIPDVDLGGFETAGKWLAVTSPEQAIVVGTSSLRIERLATYLAPRGDESYFEQGLGISAGDDERRRLADALLSEIVPCYARPTASFRSYATWLDAAYAANRQSLDATFVDVLAQIGHYYGFFVALRMWSEGESFVTRNVGLRNVFEDGAWRVRVHFVDHDSISIPTRDFDTFRPDIGFRSMRHDLTHILGGTCGRRSVPGQLAALRAIYRVGESVVDDGLRAFRTSCRDAYAQAQNAVEQKDAMRRMFTRGFVRELRDWDDLVRGWADARDESDDAVARWRHEAVAMLRARRYTAEWATELVDLILINAEDLQRFVFLVRPEPAA